VTIPNDLYGDLTDPNDPDLAPWNSAELTQRERLEAQIADLQFQLEKAKAEPSTEPGTTKPAPPAEAAAPASDHEAIVAQVNAIPDTVRADQFYDALAAVPGAVQTAPVSSTPAALSPEEMTAKLDEAEKGAADSADFYARLAAEVPGSVRSEGRSY
jgi:hypothetical protein